MTSAEMRPPPDDRAPSEQAGVAVGKPPRAGDSEISGFRPGTVLSGFHETYRRVGITAERLCQTAAQSYALADLLIAKGVIGTDELDQRRRAVEERVRATILEAGVLVELADEADKYGSEVAPVVIDCEARLPLCHAACCRLRFALTEQDLREGVVQWELPKPYLNRQRSDGYCVHCDVATGACGVYTQRPAVCRQYDCRNDRRIWADFDKRIPNPELVGLLPGRAEVSPNAPLAGSGRPSSRPDGVSVH